jgi:hypothetical protein
VGLSLVSGECEVSCDGRQQNCAVSLKEQIMTNVSISELHIRQIMKFIAENKEVEPTGL